MTNFSIYTNSAAQAAQAALISLQSVQANLGKVQNQLSTGLKVSSASDNVSVFAVAQGLRANLSSYDSINTALGDAQSAVSVAISGVTAVSNTVAQITTTLGHLADGTLSHQQRQSYTLELKNEVDTVQTYLQASTYNGVNLINANESAVLGSQQLNFADYRFFSTPSNLVVPGGLGGKQLTVQAQDLTGGTSGVDGFLGLARLVYYAAVPLDQGNDDFGNSNDAQTDAALDYASNYPPYADGSLVSRSEVAQNEAIAALGPSGVAAFYYNAITAPVVGVFSGAVANFQAQVNSALGSLSASYTNIGAQISFVQTLGSATTTDLGNLVDANLSQASAQLTALQTQQQLATQALSIANSHPGLILSLFSNTA